MEYASIKKILERKSWVYNPYRNYDLYLGKQVYLCTKWDDPTMINLKNYGKVVDITDTYICINTGYRKNYIQLPRIIYYSHEEVNYLFLKIYDNVSIKKSYRNIKQYDSEEDRSKLHQELMKSNFRTI